MDNAVFNVNGRTEEQLINTLKLRFMQHGYVTGQTASAWRFDPNKGLIFYWMMDDKANPFPVPLDGEQAARVAFAWLQTPAADNFVPIDRWDKDVDHDGSNSKGWRVYTEEWGMVDGDSRTICAIAPAYMWHGK